MTAEYTHYLRMAGGPLDGLLIHSRVPPEARPGDVLSMVIPGYPLCRYQIDDSVKNRSLLASEVLRKSKLSINCTFRPEPSLNDSSSSSKKECEEPSGKRWSRRIRRPETSFRSRIRKET